MAQVQCPNCGGYFTQWKRSEWEALVVLLLILTVVGMLVIPFLMMRQPKPGATMVCNSCGFRFALS